MRISRYFIHVLLVITAGTATAELRLGWDYPGANILLTHQAGPIVELRQDYHTSARWWFYWNFEASAAPGETATFRFMDGNVMGTRGPAVSLDQGRTWNWLGADAVSTEGKTVQFHYTFPETNRPVRFAFAPPYQVEDLHRFLAGYPDHPNLRIDSLCTSEGGREVPRLHIAPTTSAPDIRILLSARHHACESMANYVLEGLMGELLGDNEVGQWFRHHVGVLVIPFVDVDGVEKGEQGKNRSPRDHGRDYKGESLYNSTRAIRDSVPTWSEGKLQFTLDIHCPHIRGESNEKIYMVGHERPEIWAEQQRFSKILERIPGSSLPYTAANDMPFGSQWNTAANYTAGAGIFQWAGTLPGLRMAGAMEIPYANAGDVTITTENARAYGVTLLHAIRSYLAE